MLNEDAYSINLVDVSFERPTESTTGLVEKYGNFNYTNTDFKKQNSDAISSSQCNIRAFVKYLTSKSGENGIEYIDESDADFFTVKANSNGESLGTILKIVKL